MSDEPIIKPARAPEYEQTHGVAIALGRLVIATPRGGIECDDAPGFGTFLIDRTEADSRRIGLMVYVPAEEGLGVGLICQMDANSARAAAASLLRLADHLDPTRPN